MCNRHALTLAIVLALLGLAAFSASGAGASPAGGPQEFQTTYRPTVPPPAPARDFTLMGALDQAGAANALDALRLDLHGFAEVGYTYNPDYSGDPYFGRVFD